MVSHDSIRTAVGILGNIISLGLFLSPLTTFYQIWKKKSVEQFSPAPYLATLLNCMLWVLYGLPSVHPHSMLVISINGSGCAIELFFVFFFLFYSDGRKRMKVFVIFLTEVAFVGVVAGLVLTLAHTFECRSLVVGTICIFFGTLMYAAPLSVMKLVIRTRSVEYMPLSISLASLANGICWTTYALLRFDLYITIPNSLGTLFSVGQLILYAAFYKSTKKRQIEERRGREEMALSEVVVFGESNKKCNATSNGHAPEIRET
ncbi:bidirectional sugar transporter SWEET4-like isoform X1 [Tasmannia lanceolata]|uniref:bidirectional sugar transporter SWEET4-like isoform X1 n=1 Tax=Tasmannia lanceolata TaxID=3420 RepID=UPI00406289CB